MKKVVRKHKHEEVVIECVQSNKIYAAKSNYSGGIYKLQKISPNWMFCDMSDSICGLSGISKKMEAAISLVMDNRHDVFEFDSLPEFLDWVKEQL